MFEHVADLPVTTTDGRLVSAKVCRVVEAIMDYDPNLRVEWVPPEERKEHEDSVALDAFRIICRNPNGTEYIAFTVPTEEDMDERVLARVVQNDLQARGEKVTYTDLQIAEAAKKDIEQRRKIDQRAEAIDIMYHAYKSPLHKYVVNKDLIIRG